MYTMEQQYTFNIVPTIHQPSGCADFSKIYNPKSAILTYTNLNNRTTEQHIIERTKIIESTEIIESTGVINKINVKKMVYKVQPPLK